MAFCRNCGKELKDGDVFCGSCGVKTTESCEQSNINNQIAMSVWNGFLSACRNYANFSGRARRTEYWGFVLFLALFGMVANVLDSVIFGTSIYVSGPIATILALAAIIPSLAVFVRRMHDIGKSGWNYLWCLTIIGFIPILVWLLRESQSGKNKYGENPKNS